MKDDFKFIDCFGSTVEYRTCILVFLYSEQISEYQS